MTIGPDLEMQREMVRLYTVDGVAAIEIGRRMFWSPSLVRKVLHKHGVNVRPRNGLIPEAQRVMRFTDEQAQRICEMYRNGLSTNEIARRVNGSATTIRAVLKRNDVRIRDRSEACMLGRIRVIANDGKLTPPQRRCLNLLESHGEDLTTDIARLTGRTIDETARTMRQLKRFGLVTSKRAPSGRGRPQIWTRTDLPVRDVHDHVFWTAPAYGKGDMLLPVGPFRDWVNGMIRVERRAAMHLAVSPDPHGNGDGTGGISVMRTVAEMLGLSGRRLHAVLHEQDHVSLTIADRALQNYPGPVRLWDLWPELGESEAA